METRVDQETGGWRIIAPGRAARPVDRPAGRAPCPFCPGNEAMTPPEVLRVPAGSPTWQVRVVPNLYGLAIPAAGNGARAADGEVFPSSGRHEVVIESPDHGWDPRRAGTAELVTVLSAMRQRCRALAALGSAAVVAFRNHGRAAGASLAHPHSQIVALDRPPPGLVERWRRARQHRRHTGRRLHDDLVARERAEGTRMVLDTDDAVVFQPFAAAVPYETTIVPRPGAADLAGASDDDLAAVARTLPRVLDAIAAVLDDPAYNLLVHAGPAGDADAHRWYRWHLSVYPRVGTPGGLELATGLGVNSTAPEATATLLRDALAGDPDPTR